MKLKANEVCVTTETTYLGRPDRKVNIKRSYWRIWALTSKGWFINKVRIPVVGVAHSRAATILGAKIDTKHWYEATFNG